MIPSRVVFASIYILINLSHEQLLYSPSLQFHTLDLSYPMITYGGIGAIYNNTLYGFSGVYCTANSMDSCEEFTRYTQFTLNISSMKIDPNSNSIYFSNSNSSWIETQINTTGINAIHLGTGTSSSTYLNQHAWILHPSCCTEPTNVALKYNLLTNRYMNFTLYNSIIPGEYLSDSCNTNDGFEYIYSIGGRNGRNQFVSKEVYRYNILIDLWEILPDLNIQRFGASCTFVNDSLYVLGGGGMRIGSKLDTIEIYTNTNNEWNIIETRLNIGRNQHISITHPNYWIITIGGRDEMNAAAPIEIYNPFTQLIALTETIYARKQFFHALYKYNIHTYILFVFGGNFNQIVFNDIQYIILSKTDYLTTEMETTRILPINNSINNQNNLEKIKSFQFNVPIETLMIILVCIGCCLVIICISILIFMIRVRSTKYNQTRNSRIHYDMEKLPSRSPKNKKIKKIKIQRNRFISRLEGVPKKKLKLINKSRKSSEGMGRKEAIDEENNQEMNKLIIECKKNDEKVIDILDSECEDSSIEKMYIDEMKYDNNNNNNTRTQTYCIDGENSIYESVSSYSIDEKGYEWICKTLKKCDQKDWRIYFEKFKKNKVNENKLMELNDDGIWRELLPELGIRVQFQQLWKERRIKKGYAKTKGGNV